MKRFLPIIILAVASFSATAQTVSNFTFRSVVTFTTGVSVTNSVNVPATQFVAIQSAIDTWNAQRTNSGLSTITNYGHFIIESAKARVAQATNDYDERTLYQGIFAKLKTLSPADKAAIKDIIDASP